MTNVAASIMLSTQAQADGKELMSVFAFGKTPAPTTPATTNNKLTLINRQRGGMRASVEAFHQGKENRNVVVCFQITSPSLSPSSIQPLSLLAIALVVK